jgi:Fe2+ transport system protein FeoA
MTLRDLDRGARALITQVDVDDPKLRDKLHARGLLPGTEVCVLQPGDPLVVGVDHSRWALNGQEAARIHVDPLRRPHRPGLLSRLLRRQAA